MVWGLGTAWRRGTFCVPQAWAPPEVPRSLRAAGLVGPSPSPRPPEAASSPVTTNPRVCHKPPSHHQRQGPLEAWRGDSGVTGGNGVSPGPGRKSGSWWERDESFQAGWLLQPRRWGGSRAVTGARRTETAACALVPLARTRWGSPPSLGSSAGRRPLRLPSLPGSPAGVPGRLVPQPVHAMQRLPGGLPPFCFVSD